MDRPYFFFFFFFQRYEVLCIFYRGYVIVLVSIYISTVYLCIYVLCSMFYSLAIYVSYSVPTVSYGTDQPQPYRYPSHGGPLHSR